ncbi:transmembrane protein [Mycobacterium tuberculosis]|nr:transmembrane protein [Mycobacterium tuberculosis]
MPGPDGWDDDAADVLRGVPFRPMSISEMLDGAIAGIRRRPRTTLGLSVAISAVIQTASSVAAYFFIGDAARDEVTPEVLLESLGAQTTLSVLGLVLSAFGILLMAGLVAPILGRELVGMPMAPRQAWRDARPRLGRLAGTAAAVMGVSLGALLLPAVPFFALIAVDAHPALGALAGIVGFPLGIALMVWLYILFVQAVPAVVLERRTVTGALRRAVTLSKGRWFRTCGTLLLALLVTVFMGFFALRIPFLIAQLVFFGDASGSGATMGALAVDTAGRIVSWSVVLPFDAGVIALLYMDRRMRREGFDLELRSRGRSAAAVISAAGGDPGGAREDGFIDLWRTDPVPARPWTGANP